MASVAVAVLNDAVVVGAAPGWLTPGGLHGVYGLAGFMFAAESTWWLVRPALSPALSWCLPNAVVLVTFSPASGVQARMLRPAVAA